MRQRPQIGDTRPIDAPSITLVSTSTPSGAWEIVRARPSAPLAGCVRDYAGWWERLAGATTRCETPGDVIPLIFSFGAPFTMATAADPGTRHVVGSFTTGLFDTAVQVESSGLCGGLQVNLTIDGARLVFWRPLGDLVNRIVPLDDLLAAAAPALTARLAEAGSWQERFDLVEQWLWSRVCAARPADGIVGHVTRRLVAAQGRLEIATLVEEVACSHRHLIDRCRDEIGLTPKVLARVLRFGAAVDRLKRSRGTQRLVEVAADCGYYDQAHFDRDFKRFTGVPPGEWRRQFLADLMSTSA